MTTLITLMFFERTTRIPFADKCDAARDILAVTRDETLLHAIAIALRMKFDPASCDMQHLGTPDVLRHTIRERVHVIGCPKLDALTRIFCRRIIDSREYDRNDSFRSWTQESRHVSR